MKNNSSTIKILAPAKINLTLDITGKLSNGYHTVDMVMQSVGLYDEITVEKKSVSEKSQNIINIFCDKENIPCDKRNTAYKAAELFAEKCGILCNVDITIKKNIPSQAGLAGGSTDGAGVLVALNILYDTKLSAGELSEVAAKVGADVPFCLYGGTMLATGTGTDLKKIEHNFKLDNYFVLLCKPQINVSTPEAYKKSDSRPFSENIHSKALIDALINENETAFFDNLYNDFDNLLNLEDVQKIKNIMNQYGCIKSVMSGSGPTVYGFFSDYERTGAAANNLKKIYDDVCITKVCDTGCKPE